MCIRDRGFPIRTPPDLRLLAAPRGLSQLATSFIADTCLGIHHCALTYLTRIPIPGSRAPKHSISHDVKGTSFPFVPYPVFLHQKAVTANSILLFVDRHPDRTKSNQSRAIPKALTSLSTSVFNQHDRVTANFLSLAIL